MPRDSAGGPAVQPIAALVHELEAVVGVSLSLDVPVRDLPVDSLELVEWFVRIGDSSGWEEMPEELVKQLGDSGVDIFDLTLAEIDERVRLLLESVDIADDDAHSRETTA